MSLGTAEGAFDMALDYAKNRRAFGHRIADFQTIQHKLAEMATKIETARLLTYKAAWNYDNNIIEPKIFSMAKWYSARVAVEAVDEAIEIWGGHGYMVENVIGLAYRNARVLEIVEGTKEIHKNLIAHALLSGRL
jgi:alkylation response protein AidB-like acyl-CoA dehydrogenase